MQHEQGLLADTTSKAPSMLFPNGLVDLARRGARRVCRAVYVHHHILVYRWTRRDQIVDPDAVLRAQGVEMCPFDLTLARSSAHRHAHVMTPAILQLFEDTLRNGDRGFMVVRDGELVHFSWVRMRSEIITSELGPACRLPLDAEAAVIYHCWTAPSARGLGIYPHVLRRISHECGANGIDTWIYCSHDNRASLAGIEKAGFSLSHSFTAHEIFGRIMFGRVASLEA